MPLVPMRQILAEAEKKNYGIGAFNVNNMEQLQAIINAAARQNAPVILQVSHGALEYSEKEYLVAMIRVAAEKHPEIPIPMHLDHGSSLELVKEVIEMGFTSVMIDGSLEEDGKTPRSFESNVQLTREVVQYAHPRGVTVEGELGTLGGIEEHVAAREVILTDPQEARKFVEETGVDALALAIGTSHGAYKFKKQPVLRMDIIREVKRLLPDTFLVMHGSSSVPKELVDEVNAFGGKVPGAMGVPIPMIQEAIGLGIRKINIDTDGRLAFTGAIRRYLIENPAVFDQRKYLAAGRAAIQSWVERKMQEFGTSGHAGDYSPVTLDDMKKLYTP